MSDAFAELERELCRGVRRFAHDGAKAGLAGNGCAGLTGRTGRAGRIGQGWGVGRGRPVRLVVVAALLVLASTAIALAAGGVILTGAPVRPEEALNPRVGEGIPAPGTARLLSLRASDPAGGLPWGMRLVATTRGEVCVQIGRVQNGQLGVLGIDGTFHNDGRFHPVPVNALPRDVYQGHSFDAVASETASCHLSGQAVLGEHIGVERNASAKAHVWVDHASQLRDIYYGVLGPNALSIRYRAGRSVRTQNVLRPSGAYLIVTPMGPHEQAGYGGASLGGEDQLPASPPLVAITYEIAGNRCERGPSLAPWQHARVANPCPRAAYPKGAPAFRDATHVPLRVKVRVRGRRVVGVALSFAAPFAVTSAHQEYTFRSECVAGGGGALFGVFESLGRDVKAGELVTEALGDPFTGCPRRSARIEVLYGPPVGRKALVGVVNVRRPAGTLPTPRLLPRR